jgi:hypothetical protein
VLLHARSHERARRLLERCLREEQQAPAAGAGAAAGPQLLPRLRALLGWVVLSQQLEEPAAARDAGEVSAAAALFGAAVAQDPSDLGVSGWAWCRLCLGGVRRLACRVGACECRQNTARRAQALLGQARALEAQGRVQAAADLAGELAIRWPWFVPGLIERARLLLAASDWEGMAGAAGQLLQADASNVTGLSLLGGRAGGHTGGRGGRVVVLTWRLHTACRRPATASSTLAAHNREGPTACLRSHLLALSFVLSLGVGSGLCFICRPAPKAATRPRAAAALHALVREGSARGAAARLAELAEAAAREEPRGAHIAHALVRGAGGGGERALPPPSGRALGGGASLRTGGDCGGQATLGQQVGMSHQTSSRRAAVALLELSKGMLSHCWSAGCSRPHQQRVISTAGQAN